MSRPTIEQDLAVLAALDDGTMTGREWFVWNMAHDLLARLAAVIALCEEGYVVPGMGYMLVTEDVRAAATGDTNETP